MANRNMNKILEQFNEIGIIPVVVLEHKEDAAPLAHALCEGGLPAAEVTFRTREAAACISAMRQARPDMLVGAGTVLTVEQVDEAINAGAQFIVSPGFDEEVVTYCIEKDIPVTPGTCTPSDVQKAYRLGLDVVKFFPAEPAGGIAMIKAMAAPYTMMKFMPTGGISEKNMESYVKEDVILCIGGSWMVKKDLIDSKQFDRIEEITRSAVKKLNEVRG